MWGVVEQLGGAERRGRVDGKQVQRVHGFEARHGGVGMWCDMPVQLLPAGYRRVELLRAERA